MKTNILMPYCNRHYAKLLLLFLIIAYASCRSAPEPVPQVEPEPVLQVELKPVPQSEPEPIPQADAMEEAGTAGEIDIDVLESYVIKVHGQITGAIPEKTKIALVDVQAEDIYIKDFIFEEFVAHLVNSRKYVVVDRYHLDLVKAELNLQYSGDFDDDSIVSIGRFLGAKMVLSAAISPRGKNYSLRFRLHDVETAEILAIVTEVIPTDVFGGTK